MKNQSVSNNIDWVIVTIYIALVTIGWLNIYSADMTPDSEYYFDFTQNYGKQLIFISLNIVLIQLLNPLLSKPSIFFSHIILC